MKMALLLPANHFSSLYFVKKYVCTLH